jgi:hypothetical protein
VKPPGKHEIIRLAGWLLLSVCVAAIRGFGFLTAAWAAAFLPLAYAPEKADPGPVSIIFLCIAAVAPASGVFTVLVAVSALLVVWHSREAIWRGVGVLSTAICAGLLFFGLPVAQPPGLRPVQESYRESATVWENVPSLDSGKPSLYFRTAGGGAFLISVEAGGIRDTEPVGVIRVGEREILIRNGVSIHELELEAPDSIVVIEMTRPWRPFEHPVIHFGEVVLTRGERQ